MATPAILLQLKAMGRKDLYHIQGFMQILMKPRNGERWTPGDKIAIRAHLKSLASTLPLLLVFTLPGGSLLLPLLAWHLDRRKKKLVASISPDSPKSASPSQVDGEQTSKTPSN